MNVLYAARFTTVVFLSAAGYTWLQVQPGLVAVGMGTDRWAWLAQHSSLWSLGWWLATRQRLPSPFSEWP